MAKEVIEVQEQKEKTCFVIMPISDVEPYPTGHFKRVYEHLIKPACKIAGFIPIRADDVQTTNYIALDIVKNILNAEMAICDLSGRNPNVLYELGIRQAFNKPVTLIKDTSTSRIFDIAGFRDVEYDESLRIDTVHSNLETISETIKNTYENDGHEVNSLITLLGVEPAKLEKPIEISKDTEILISYVSAISERIRNIEQRIIPKRSTSINLDVEHAVFDSHGVKPGDKINHQKFGNGLLLLIEGSLQNPVGTILFDEHGEKKIMMNYAKITKLI